MMTLGSMKVKAQDREKLTRATTTRASMKRGR
jgi:hypothetical protein